MESPKIHPEIAEGYIATVIRDYGTAGHCTKVPMDWDAFRESHFYAACVEKYDKDAVEKVMADQQKSLAASNIDLNKVQPNADEVIKQYVNAGLAIGLSPDWDKFRESKFYAALTAYFPKEEVDSKIATAKKNTDPLNKTLGELGLS